MKDAEKKVQLSTALIQCANIGQETTREVKEAQVSTRQFITFKTSFFGNDKRCSTGMYVVSCALCVRWKLCNVFQRETFGRDGNEKAEIWKHHKM